MVEIAVDLKRALARRVAAGTPGEVSARAIAGGDGWSVADVICTSGPADRRFEEWHTHYSVAIVVAGTFQLRSPAGETVMTPGALMLGNEGQPFECGHEHGDGDRCVSFYFNQEYFARLARESGVRLRRPSFGASRIPPVRDLSPLIVEVTAGLTGASIAWEEVALGVATKALRLSNAATHSAPAPIDAAARVTRAVRAIDGAPEDPHTLAALARGVGLSPFHFLRTFQRLVGLTPHQYVRRARLRTAARRLTTSAETVLDIALDCGFGDVSNFNRAFRAEFGVPPTHFRCPSHHGQHRPHHAHA